VVQIDKKTMEQLLEELKYMRSFVCQTGGTCEEHKPECNSCWTRHFSERWYDQLSRLYNRPAPIPAREPTPGREMWVKAEDRHEEYRLVKALDAFLVLWDLVNNRDHLSGKLRYGHDFKTADEALEWCAEDLCNLIDEYGIDLGSAII